MCHRFDPDSRHHFFCRNPGSETSIVCQMEFLAGSGAGSLNFHHSNRVAERMDEKETEMSGRSHGCIASDLFAASFSVQGENP